MIKSIEFQFEFMTDESKDEYENYIPNYVKLVEEAPNITMANEWVRCKSLLEKIAKSEGSRKSEGFAFNCVYMVKKDDGKYHIYQTPAKTVDELIDWILRVDLKVV